MKILKIATEAQRHREKRLFLSDSQYCQVKEIQLVEQASLPVLKTGKFAYPTINCTALSNSEGRSMVRQARLCYHDNFFNFRTLGFLFLFVFCSGLIAGERDEMDQILQKELGQNPSKQTIENTTKKPQDKIKEPVNPVEERYKREEDESSSLLWTLVKIILVFGILTAIMYYVLKFISKNRQSLYPVKDAMRVLASLPLAPSKQLQIVDVSGILLIIGVSDGSVNLIKEIDSSEIKERIYQAKESHEPQSENFLEVLMSNFKHLDFKVSLPLGKHKNTEVNEEEIMDEIKFRQLERLEKLKNERANLSGGKGRKSSNDFS